MARRELTKPEGMTVGQWEASLLSLKRDILAQMRRSIHTRGNNCQSYLDRIDQALKSIQ